MTWLLAEAGYSTRAAARTANIDYSQVDAIVKGRGDPKLSVLLALVDLLRLGSIDELVAPSGTALLLASQAEGSATQLE